MLRMFTRAVWLMTALALYAAASAQGWPMLCCELHSASITWQLYGNFAKSSLAPCGTGELPLIWRYDPYAQIA